MKRRFLALVLAGCLAAVLSTAAWATSPTGFYLNVELPGGETPQDLRDIYIQFLEERIKHSELFVNEAQNARKVLI